MNNVCGPKPACQIEAFPEADQKGTPQLVGPYYFQESQQMVTHEVGNLHVKSMKVSGGCGKIVFMKVMQYDSTKNSVVTNWMSNDDIKVGDKAGGAIAFGIFPKKN